MNTIEGISYQDDVAILRKIFTELRLDERIRNGDLTPDELVWATLKLFSEGIFLDTDIRDGLSRFLLGRSH